MKPFQVKLLLRQEELVGRAAARHPDVVEDRRLWLDYKGMIKPAVSTAGLEGRHPARISESKNIIIPLRRVL